MSAQSTPLAELDAPPALDYVWLWRQTTDPNRPKSPRRLIAHPLAARKGEPCRVLAQGRNGNRLVEFADGYRVVAPFYAVLPA